MLDEEKELVRKLYLENSAATVAIAKRVGKSPATIKRFLKKEGIYKKHAKDFTRHERKGTQIFYKDCSLCRERKLIFEFRERKDQGDGFRNECISCCAKRDKVNYDKRASSGWKGKGRRVAPKSRTQLDDEAYKKKVSRILNPKKTKEIRKRYYKKNRNEILEKTKDQRINYYYKNKDKVVKQQTKYLKNRIKTDPGFKIKTRLSSRIRTALKEQGGEKSASTIQLTGLSVLELRKYIESLWLLGMNWENYGIWRKGEPMTWHIDHILSCSSFDLTKEDEQCKCFHYTNLRPLWAIDNILKGSSIPRKNSVL